MVGKRDAIGSFLKWRLLPRITREYLVLISSPPKARDGRSGREKFV